MAKRMLSPLTPEELDLVLARFDLTAPALQREIVGSAFQRLTHLVGECQKVLRGLEAGELSGREAEFGLRSALEDIGDPP